MGTDRCSRRQQRTRVEGATGVGHTKEWRRMNPLKYYRGDGTGQRQLVDDVVDEEDRISWPAVWGVDFIFAKL